MPTQPPQKQWLGDHLSKVEILLYFCMNLGILTSSILKANVGKHTSHIECLEKAAFFPLLFEKFPQK